MCPIELKTDSLVESRDLITRDEHCFASSVHYALKSLIENADNPFTINQAECNGTNTRFTTAAPSGFVFIIERCIDVQEIRDLFGEFQQHDYYS